MHRGNLCVCAVFVVLALAITTNGAPHPQADRDTVQIGWRKINNAGFKARAGHTANYVGTRDEIITFGGRNGRLSFSQDFYSFNTTTQTWRGPESGAGSHPDHRGMHTATMLSDDSLLVFGGRGAVYGLMSSQFDDIKILNPRTGLWRIPTVSGPSPPKRSGHTATYLPRENVIVIFGGTDGTRHFNDMYFLTLSTNNLAVVWSEVQQRGNIPVGRQSHTAIGYQNRLFIFGGETHKGPVADMQIFCYNDRTWITPEIYGSAPIARYGHTASAIGSNMIIFGGSSPRGYLDDVAVFNMESLYWRKVEYLNTERPSAREYAASTAVAGRIYVIGGDTGSLAEDVYALQFQFRDVAWVTQTTLGQIPATVHLSSAAIITGAESASPAQLLTFGGLQSAFLSSTYNQDLHTYDIRSRTWKKQPAVRNTPSARAGHSLTKIAANQFLLFGGESRGAVFRNSYLNDAYRLDATFDTHLSWHLLDPRGHVPTARSAHTATLFNDKVVIIGGYDGNRALSDVFIATITGNTISYKHSVLLNFPARQYHSAVDVTIKGKHCILLFGGKSHSNTPLNDLILIHFDNTDATWEHLAPTGAIPPPRYGHAAIVHTGPLSSNSENVMVIFGGANDNGDRSDVWALDLNTLQWTEGGVRNAFPRSFHSAVSGASQLYSFGGRNNQADHNDLHVLDLTALTNSYSYGDSPAVSAPPVFIPPSPLTPPPPTRIPDLPPLRVETPIPVTPRPTTPLPPRGQHVTVPLVEALLQDTTNALPAILDSQSGIHLHLAEPALLNRVVHGVDTLRSQADSATHLGNDASLLEEARRLIALWFSKYDGEKKNLDELRALINSLESSLEQYQRADAIKAMDDQIKALQKLADELAAALAEYTDLEQRIKELDRLIDNAQKELVEPTNQRRDLQNRANGIDNELKGLVRERGIKLAQETALAKQLADANRDIGDLPDRLLGLRAERQELMDKIANCDALLGAYDEKAARDRVDDAEKKLADLQAKRKSLQKLISLSEASEEKKGIMQSTMGIFQDLTKTVDTISRTELSDPLDLGVTHLPEEIAEMTDKMQRYIKSYLQKLAEEEAALLRERDQAEKDRDSLMRNHNNLLHERAEAQRVLLETERRIRELEALSQRLEEALRSRQQALAAVQSELAAIAEQIADKEAAKVLLDTQVADATARANALLKDLQALQADRTARQQRLQGPALSELERLYNNNKRALEDIIRKRQSLEDRLRRMLDQLNGAVALLEREENSRRELDEIMARIRALFVDSATATMSILPYPPVTVTGNTADFNRHL
eukprot:TRINITY_DN2324_c0_g1_i1.p1 TRINITY_DN2324_c0_g1~~TRINITY_DN2324_c0_g1_i1.p1  ORF type:complete len:1317 (-),score=271.09 TRINITY_DN2324_c0_g1_i1:27-3917(-)